MNTLEKVKEEVRRLLTVWKWGDSSEAKYKYEAYEELMPLLESLQEEPVSDTQSPIVFYGLTGSVVNTNEEPVNKNLEEAAEKCRWDIEESCYQNDNGSYLYSEDDIEESFKSGANWQKEQIQHNMEAAKQFIKDCTRTCSNEAISGLYESWLTPEQAMRAIEIATENKLKMK